MAADTPFHKLPSAERKRVERIFKYLIRFADLKLCTDDNVIRPLATKLGIPGMESLPLLDEPSGTVVQACDGNISYMISAHDKFDESKDNGYNMITVDTHALRKIVLMGVFPITEVVVSLLYILGFDGKERIGTLRPFDFVHLN